VIERKTSRYHVLCRSSLGPPGELARPANLKLLLQRDVIRALETQNLQYVQGGLPKVLNTTGSDVVCCA
jgi:hypothetical protein